MERRWLLFSLGIRYFISALSGLCGAFMAEPDFLAEMLEQCEHSWQHVQEFSLVTDAMLPVRRCLFKFTAFPRPGE
jgi:hypothetical protein